MDTNFIKLKELTNNLPKFPATMNADVGFKEFKMDEGICFSWYLYESDGEVGVHRWFNSKGTKFPEHVHPEKEWIIVFRGKAIFDTPEGKKELSVGDSYYHEPNTKHSAYFPEDTFYITVMIPKSKEYPHAE